MKGALSMPGVNVDRDVFLITTLRQYGVSAAELIEGRPSDYLSQEVLERVAKSVVNNHTTKVTAISTAAGIPGGFAMLGTVPADMAQFFWHYLVMAQKLAYIYGWPDFRDEKNNLTEEAQNIITLFVGVGFGVEGAQTAIREVAQLAAAHWSKKISRMALTRTFWYPVVKRVAGWLGIKLTRDSVGKAAGKFIPILGGIISGALTLATFKPMATKLRKELATSQLRKQAPKNINEGEGE